MLFIVILISFLISIFLVYAYIPSFINKQKFFRRKKAKKEKVIYLTFDDGPSEYTKDLLELLKKYNIKATFFCVANFAKKHKDIIEKMKQDEHLIALHSLKHKNSMLQGVRETKADLEEALEIMKEFGIEINFYRPPWGDSNLCLLKLLKNKNINFFLWDVMAEDWLGNTSEEIIADKLLKRVNSGDVICLHDGRGKNEAPMRTIYALKKVIPIFLKKGYIFKTINE